MLSQSLKVVAGIDHTQTEFLDAQRNLPLTSRGTSEVEILLGNCKVLLLFDSEGLFGLKIAKLKFCYPVNLQQTKPAAYVRFSTFKHFTSGYRLGHC